MIAEQRERSFRTTGYRRMRQVLKKRGIHRNPKTILCIMEIQSKTEEAPLAPHLFA
ncbi:MAG: hypothetical protein ACLSX2_07410 [Christensenellaceae bacterium]